MKQVNRGTQRWRRYMKNHPGCRCCPFYWPHKRGLKASSISDYRRKDSSLQQLKETQP